MDSSIETITTQVTETEDELTFQTLSDYIAKDYMMVVKEEEIVKAISLIRACNETGTDLRECYNTATYGTELYRKGYMKGFADGMQEARKRLENAFKEETKND